MNATAADTSTSGSDLPGVIDDRTPEVRRLDYATNLVIDLAAAVDKLIQNMPQGNTQRIIYKTEGMGALGIICAALCVLCVLFVIVGVVVISSDTTKSEARMDGRLRDLQAWNDITRKDIARLQAQQENRK